MIRRSRTTLVALTVLGVVGLPGVAADDFTLDWWTVDSGGDMWTSGGEFELSGTIGQPDAGVSMTGADFELVGGFWAAVEECCPCDLDGDCDVDLADLAELLGAYGCCQGDACYNADADFDGSGCIDLSDLAELLGNYGCGT